MSRLIGDLSLRDHYDVTVMCLDKDGHWWSEKAFKKRRVLYLATTIFTRPGISTTNRKRDLEYDEL